MKHANLPGLKHGTIACYWMDHGYSAAEARQLEKEQIQKLLEQEDIFDALENVGWSPVTACKQ